VVNMVNVAEHGKRDAPLNPADHVLERLHVFWDDRDGSGGYRRGQSQLILNSREAGFSPTPPAAVHRDRVPALCRERKNLIAPDPLGEAKELHALWHFRLVIKQAST
jgi:hypothetical protein